MSFTFKLFFWNHVSKYGIPANVYVSFCMFPYSEYQYYPDLKTHVFCLLFRTGLILSLSTLMTLLRICVTIRINV